MTDPPRRQGGPKPGLIVRRGKAKYARPARPVETLAPPVKPVAFAPMAIDSHRALAGRQKEIAERVAAAPDLGVMLLINPVLAFERLGVKLSPEIAHHILHAIQHPTALRTRRDELEAKLKEALGESAQPTVATWNQHFLFELRKLAPLEIGENVPVYLPPLGQEESAKLHALRPAATRRYPQPRLLSPRNRVGSVPWKESLRRIDLNAPTPKLPPAKEPPEQVPLEDLWFYKDQDGLVRDALELGVIQRRAFPVHSPDSFRKILEGEKSNAFRTWIKSVRFNPRGET
ncbi:MAG: hypothetical protein ACXWVT_08160 [Burkholderiaceae bacterium]